MENVLSLLASYPGLVLAVAVLGFGIVKKLLKLAIFAGLLLVIWVALQTVI